MAKRLIIVARCPLCGKPVKQVPDGILRQHPHKDDCEMIITRTGYKQYIHSSCWYDMIAEKRPYDGKLYL